MAPAIASSTPSAHACAAAAAFGLRSPSRTEERACQEFEVPSSEASSDQSQLVAAGELEQQLGARSGSPVSKRASASATGRVRSYGAGVQLLREFEASSAVESARSMSPAANAAYERLNRCQVMPWGLSTEPRGFDRAVEHVARLRHPAANPERASEHRHDQRKEVALPGRPADPQRPLGVRSYRLEVVEVEVGRREIREGVQRERPARRLRGRR